MAADRSSKHLSLALLETRRLLWLRPLGTGEGEVAQEELAQQEERRGMVLVVEDEPALRELVVETLIERGYCVASAAGGEEAIQVLRDHGVNIRVLLTDVRMPGMRGPELAAVARSSNPHLAVIFMSGYSDELALQSVPIERAALLQKPFTTETLCSRLEAIYPPEPGSA